jgi:hypothetical protein
MTFLRWIVVVLFLLALLPSMLLLYMSEAPAEEYLAVGFVLAVPSAIAFACSPRSMTGE